MTSKLFTFWTRKRSPDYVFYSLTFLCRPPLPLGYKFYKGQGCLSGIFTTVSPVLRTVLMQSRPLEIISVKEIE